MTIPLYHTNIFLCVVCWHRLCLYTHNMNTGKTTNTTRKRTQRTHALESASIADWQSLTCRQRKKLHSVVHARQKRLGHCTEHKFDNMHTHVAGLRNLDRTCQNDREVTFDNKYRKHTLHSIAEHKTYYPAPTIYPTYKDTTGIDTQWEKHIEQNILRQAKTC